jgi:transcriptional regulator with XRE-family HTH domain
MIVSVAQLRAARALLGWTADDLGRRARVHRHTVGKLESNKATPQRGTLARIVAALEAGGIEFTPGDGVQPKTTFRSF